MRALKLSAALAAVLAGGACGNPNNLPPATIPNAVDTATLSALTGTPIPLPSAFSVAGGRVVRSDTSSFFDFAFQIDSVADSARAYFLPAAVIGLTQSGFIDPGLLKTDLPFDQITEAAGNGYVTTDTVFLKVGDRYYGRSRSFGVCTGLGVPQYGKFEILAIDFPGRTVTFRFLTDNNCGYLGLEPGTPSK